MRLFLCVFFFLSFTHSSSHVLHDFELSSSFKSKFCLVRPFSQEHVRTSNVEKRLQKKKKKKKKKEVEERKRVNQRTLLFPNQV